LHHVWQLQYFDKAGLTTAAGEAVQIISPGFPNEHAGPDFSQARMRLDAMEWVGAVEIHIRSSDWYRHAHQHDHAYDSVVLHVVWQHDKEVFRQNGSPVPVLELRSRVSEALVKSYTRMMNTSVPIPCARQLDRVSHITKFSMLQRALMDRLETKAAAVKHIHDHCQGDWEETTYRLLAQSFGFKTNGIPFAQLANALPFKIIARHHNRPEQIDALLFGVAGFLDAPSADDYTRLLQREFALLSAKFNLASALKMSQWKFLRMRPANFPTVRLAQFSALLASHAKLFSQLTAIESYRQLQSLFQNSPGSYWATHWRPGKKAARPVGAPGKKSIESLIINAVLPLLVAYGKARGEQLYIDRAMQWLQALPPEKNSITARWQKAGLIIGSSLESQGAIELYNSYCSQRQCLRCHIGTSLLKPGAA